MKALSGRHPLAVCVYFLCVQVPVIFGINPVTAGIALLCGLWLWRLTDREAGLRGMLLYLAIPLLSSLINPLFNHNGVTVLFFLNSNPVTLEAFLNGLALGLVIGAALVWARCFTAVMDTDRLLCVTGALSPKLSLVLSMTLRYIPLLRRQAGKTREAQRAAGLMREANPPDQLRSGARVFSGLVTWALENGVVTADSMTARGFGSGRRSRYRVFPWERGDTVLACCSLLLLAVPVTARLLGRIGYVWYPVLQVPAPDGWSLAAYGAFGLLCLLGSGMALAEGYQWKRMLARLPEGACGPGGEEGSHGNRCACRDA